MMMEKDIIYFDEKGFLPSKKVRTIDKYLNESSQKERIWKEFRKDPHEFVFEQFGLKDGFEIGSVSKQIAEDFYKVFWTNPYSGIVVDASVLKEICLSENSVGAVEWVKKYGTEIFMPFLTSCEKERTLLHESVHCVRDQLNEFSLGYLYVEDALAYCIDRSIPKKEPIIFNVLDTFQFYLSDFSGEEDNSKISRLLNKINCSINLPEVYFQTKKTALFKQKCEEENLNFYYLFLRTSPSSYTNKKPITEQIDANKGVIWDILRTRLNN